MNDDFARFEGGPMEMTGKTTVVIGVWPPPEIVKLSDLSPLLNDVDDEAGVYERVSFSQLTDEQMETMTHVARGALYRWKSKS